VQPTTHDDDLPDDTEELLEELQAAAEAHQAILKRQAELIARLRAELKGVPR